MAGLQTDDAVFQGMSEAKKDEYLGEKHLGTVSETSHPVTEDGVELPSEEDRINLRRVPGNIPWPAFLIAIIECCERFSYYGATVVFTNFIQQRRPSYSPSGACGDGDCTSGALGKGQQASTGLTTFNSFWVYVMPLLGAYMADAHWGRYKTICIAVAIAMFGHVLLVVSAIPSVIDNPTGALACFIIAILIMGVGTGGFKSSISPLVAEQMPEQRLTVQVTKKGERVLLDPALTSGRIYLYFYLMINIGALIGQIGMSYSEKYVGFWLAYLLPTAVFFICPIVLWVGRNRYIRTAPKGSIFGISWRTFKLAAKGKWSLNPVATYKNFNKPGFWDAAKPSMFTPEERPAWMTHDDVFVDELARAINACFVFCYFPIYWLTYNQLNNNLTSQAAVMKTNGVPNDVLSNLDPFALIILIPICDKFLYPGLRKLGINFTPIKRMAFGFFLGSAAMIWATVIQQYIYNMSECGYNAAGLHADGKTACAPVDINVWAQTGSYVLIAISEIFASITGLEYAFSKAPKSMRSMVMAIFLFMSAFSSALGEAFVPLSADPLLVWNYGAMAVLSFIAGVLFWIQFRHLDSQENVLNEIGNGAPGEAAKRHDIEHPQEKRTVV